MKQKASFAPAEAAKMLLIFVLIVLMLVLLILLVVGQNRAAEETLPQADRMVVYASGAQPLYDAGMDTARVTPYLIAYRVGGGTLSVLHASDAPEKPYEALYPLLRTLFGAGAYPTLLSRETGAILWEACRAADDLIYIRYNGTLPAAVIRAYTYSEEDSETVAAVLDAHVQGTAYARELFLIPGTLLSSYADLLGFTPPCASTDICALAMDGAGNAALFCAAADAAAPAVQSEDGTGNGAGTQDPDVQPYSTDTPGALDAYIASMEALSSGAQKGAFSRTGVTEALLLDGIYRMPEIVLSACDPQTALYADREKLEAVLGMLGMTGNDTDSYYTDGTGARIYLNSRGQLTVAAAGTTLRYEALQDGGLALSDYLGYASIGGDYLLSEYLRAADRLLSGLELLEGAFGGDALTCTLIGVTAASEDEQDTVVLTYGYTCRGIPLLDENGAIRRAMVVRAGDGVISHLELYPCHAVLAEEDTWLLPQTVARDAILEERQNVPEGLFLAYPGDGDGVYTADWIGFLPVP